MKIIFTADLHIKLRQKNIPVEWARDRYTLLIEKLVKLQKGCDLFILGGDLFDRVPSMEELEIYYDLVHSCSIPTLIYAGNHEMFTRNTTFLTYLKSSTHRLNSKVEIIDDFYSNEIFDIVPYNKLKEKYPWDLEYSRNILFTHVRGDIPPYVKAEIDLNLLNPWSVVLAGDLHSYANSQRNIIYPGSPVTVSFHRSNVDTGVIILDTDTLKHEWIKLDLPQLIRKTIQAGEPMPATSPDHTIYAIEGDMSELGDIEDNELIDKKVIKRETDTALILTPEMSLQEELKEYLLYILQLNEEVVEEAIGLLNDNLDSINE